MFDLEAEIIQWRQSFGVRWPGAVADIDELEDHLREEFSALTTAGHSDSEAWALAQTRLGAPDRLCREFARAGRLTGADRAAVAIILGGAGVVLAWAIAASTGRAPQQAVAGKLSIGSD